LRGAAMQLGHQRRGMALQVLAKHVG